MSTNGPAKSGRVDIVKEGSRFQPRRFIETGMADVHRRVVAARYFRGTSPEAFADGTGSIMGDVNHVHPFREGNGRTQLQYLKQLAERAGRGLDLTQLDRDTWMEASRLSNLGDHDASEALHSSRTRISVRPRSSGSRPGG